jgi:SIR2-like domain
MKIAFLLGSGVSLHLKLPSTKKLTEEVLSGKGVIRHTDAVYYYNQQIPSSKNYPSINELVEYLKLLSNQIKDYAQKNNIEYDITYETLSYIAIQIRDALDGEFENPAIQPLIDKLNAFYKKENTEYLKKLTTETVNYIYWIIFWNLKSIQYLTSNHLDALTKACSDSAITQIDIFTLNHDTAIEETLELNHLKFTDGFKETANGIKSFYSETYDIKENKIRLFKLHGSIDWRENENKIQIRTNSDITKFPITRKPKFLIGTFNKMLSYTSGIYAELYHKFYRYLPESEFLIASGYSFGDKGINARIITWLYKYEKAKLIIISPEKENIFYSNSRGAIANNVEELKNAGKLKYIQKSFEKISYDEIFRETFKAKNPKNDISFFGDSMSADTPLGGK